MIKSLGLGNSQSKEYPKYVYSIQDARSVPGLRTDEAGVGDNGSPHGGSAEVVDADHGRSWRVDAYHQKKAASGRQRKRSDSDWLHGFRETRNHPRFAGAEIEKHDRLVVPRGGSPST